MVFLWVHNYPVALGMSLVDIIAASLWVGPAYALVQSLAGVRLRAIGAATCVMIVNIVGLGLGPYVTGAVSDVLTPRFGTDALTISLTAVTLTYIVGIACFLVGARTVSTDIEEADRGMMASQHATRLSTGATP